MLYSTNWMIQELNDDILHKFEFINIKNPKIHTFKCIDNKIGQDELGDGWVYDFDVEKFKNDLWRKSIKKYK